MKVLLRVGQAYGGQGLSTRTYSLSVERKRNVKVNDTLVRHNGTWIITSSKRKIRSASHATYVRAIVNNTILVDDALYESDDTGDFTRTCGLLLSDGWKEVV